MFSVIRCDTANPTFVLSDPTTGLPPSNQYEIPRLFPMYFPMFSTFPRVLFASKLTFIPLPPIITNTMEPDTTTSFHNCDVPNSKFSIITL